MNLQEELKLWADETAKFYHKKATSDEKYDIFFYIQSDLTKIQQSPDLLILGINPGSGGKYSENPMFGKIDGNTLLEGNKEWKNRDKWQYWNNIKGILNRPDTKDILQDDSRFVLSNVTFFATPKEYLLPADVFSECAKKTIGLINILQPKFILCLGNNCIASLKKEEKIDTKELFPGLLSYGKFNGIPISAIKHPAARYAKEEKELVGKCLEFLMTKSDQDILPEEIQEIFTDEIKAVEERRNRGEYLQEWLCRLEKDFPNKIIKDKINDKTYPQFGIVFNLGNTTINVQLEAFGRNLYYGFPKKGKNQNEEDVIQFLASFFEDFKESETPYWYGFKNTSFENAYNDFKSLVEKTHALI